MAINICVLRSGSAANCTAIFTETECLLVDCGKISVDDLVYDLKDIGIDLSNIKGIIVTHGHGDHINGNTIKFSKEYSVPVYLHPKIYDACTWQRVKVEECHKSGLVKFHSLKKFNVEGFSIKPVELNHQPKNYHNVGISLGFCITRRNQKIGYIVDTRELTAKMRKNFLNLTALVIETNYDEEIAFNDRQHGWDGHFSNNQAGEAINQIIQDSNCVPKYIFLAHRSDRNNTAEKSCTTVSKILNRPEIQLIDTHRHKKTKVYTI